MAWLAADRSMQAAQRSENPTTMAASARIVTHALTRDRRYRTATNFAEDMAAWLDSATQAPSPDSLSVYGALLLRGAAAAARAEDRGTALRLLEEAEAAASRLGADHNHQWTAFGPVNVALHRVHIAVALGDAGSAIDCAGGIPLEAIEVTERKAALCLDLARAYTQWGKLDRAYASLLRANQLAPEELKSRPAVHSLIGDLESRASGHLHASVTELAERVGLTA